MAASFPGNQSAIKNPKSKIKNTHARVAQLEEAADLNSALFEARISPPAPKRDFGFRNAEFGFCVKVRLVELDTSFLALHEIPNPKSDTASNAKSRAVSFSN
jgi:hypothetical protein